MVALSSLSTVRAARTLGIAVTLALVGSANGQLVVDFGTATTDRTGPGSVGFSPIVSSVAAFPGLTTVESRIDWNWNLPRADFSGGMRYSTFVQFTIGALPVRINNVFSSLNGKWVNGGGNGENPVTTVATYLALFELLPVSGVVAIDSIAYPQHRITGNGLKIVNDATVTPSGYVLASGRTYFLDFQVVTSISVAGFASTTPSITVTNELGGLLSPGYNGVRAGLEWEVVPAPSAAGLLALAGLSAARRRR
jgi:hypothetical protein